jgi:hypothetical protein
MSYIQDPNNTDKQIPKGLSVNHGSKAITPANCAEAQAASYVLVNSTGSFSFRYGTTDATSSMGSFTQGIVSHIGDNATPVRLDINATAWSGSTAGHTYNTGDVTFVYVNTRT